MKLLLTAERTGTDGVVFKTAAVLPHRPVQFTPGVAGWQGEGAGMSLTDLGAIMNSLSSAACNVQKFTVELVDSVDDHRAGE